MSEGWNRVALDAVEPNPEKPGRRWELSPPLGIEAFNLNLAELVPGERLSQNHYHYHEHQHEAFLPIDGDCRVETADGGFTLGPSEAVRFAAGESGAHVIHNPFDRSCTLIAIGWPADGRYPVHRLAETAELLAERYRDPPE